MYPTAEELKIIKIATRIYWLSFLVLITALIIIGVCTESGIGSLWLIPIFGGPILEEVGINHLVRVCTSVQNSRNAKLHKQRVEREAKLRKQLVKRQAKLRIKLAGGLNRQTGYRVARYDESVLDDLDRLTRIDGLDADTVREYRQVCQALIQL